MPHHRRSPVLPPRSHHLRPESNPVVEYRCAECGCFYLAKSLRCPYCSSTSGSTDGDEFLKKVPDNDLFK